MKANVHWLLVWSSITLRCIYPPPSLSLSLSCFLFVCCLEVYIKMALDKLKGVSLVSVWDPSWCLLLLLLLFCEYACHLLCLTKFCLLIRISQFWLCLEYLLLLCFIFLVSSQCISGLYGRDLCTLRWAHFMSCLFINKETVFHVCIFTSFSCIFHFIWLVFNCSL